MLKLVYVCLAGSLIACALLFISASKDSGGFHGTTKVMGDALIDDAEVLAADAHGAITQTGNGIIRGYTRSGKVLWSSKFDPFEKGPTNPYGAGEITAHAWCTAECPAAITQIDSKFAAFGGQGEALASKLTSMKLDDKSVLAIRGTRGALLSVGPTASNRTLYSLLDGTAKDLGVPDPTVATIDRRGNRAIVGSSRGTVGIITRIQWSEGPGMRVIKPAIKEVGLGNSCISPAGSAVGLVGQRAKQLTFTGKPGPALGPRLGSGTCSVDSNGITVVYTPDTAAPPLVAVRYSRSGKRLWAHTFGGQRLVSKGSAPMIVAEVPGGSVTGIDAVTGRTVFKQQIEVPPFIAPDGSIIATNRKGEPRWLFVGKPPTAN
jgi:hypothetical protein